MAASKYRLAVIYLKIVNVYNLSGYIVHYIIMLGRINHDSESSRGCLFMSTKSNQRYKRKGIGNEIFTKFLREAFRVIGRG